MPKIYFEYRRVDADETKYGAGYTFNTLSKQDFESFNSQVLGLGDVSQEGEYIQAIAAFFDLEGFTSFCNQVDSHLVIPEFLKQYLDWLFGSLTDRFKEGETQRTVTLWGGLPFFAKFLGDGILSLWNTAYYNYLSDIFNIVVILYGINNAYVTDFLPKIRKHVSKPPTKLRCGIARGQIISVGNGEDYVGSCINIAARLQKLSQLSFAISRRGFDLSEDMLGHEMWQEFILKKVELRGIGDEELVFIKKKEFRRLHPDERRLFKNP